MPGASDGFASLSPCSVAFALVVVACTPQRSTPAGEPDRAEPPHAEGDPEEASLPRQPVEDVDAGGVDATVDATVDAGLDATLDAQPDRAAPPSAPATWKFDAGALGADDAAADPRCAPGMLYVSGSFCPKVERNCLKSELNGANHITICHAFEPNVTKCLEPEEPRAFCIDRYEYPNERGAHPAWMVTWYDAQATCESKGKRLCYESEWTMACEGPEKTPFPYGWSRDQTACNVDNFYIEPKLDAMYPDGGYDAALPELERLDQSVPSGAMPRCVSGFGVRDMPGNFDEWVTNDQAERATAASDHGMWSALKGGAWGHVRNACRPLTTSHSPGWSYFFTSFRCCSDAKGAPAYEPPKTAWPAPKVAAGDKAPKVIVKSTSLAPGPSRTKVKPQN